LAVKESVKCPHCEEQVIKADGIFDSISNKWYHPTCFKILSEKRELARYVCVLFKLKAPGPKVYNQMKTFYNKGISYEEMLKVLKYHFEVKRGKVEKAMEGIGIIPYILEEAREYYGKLDYKSDKLADKLADNCENQQKVIIYIDEQKVGEKKQKQNNCIDLNSL
jgi:hypothetical protein